MTIRALYCVPLLLTACASTGTPGSVRTTSARAQAGEDTGYGYEFDVDSVKNAGSSPASALTLAHAAGDRVPPETVQALIRQHYAAFSACYDAGAKSQPNLSGDVIVKFVATADGATTQAVNHGSTLGDSGVVDCVAAEFGKISYPSGGGVLTVVYPVHFGQ